MSTRSAIGIQRKDGTIEAIYCHCNGYPTGNGVILFNCYNDVKKINKLLKLGDISILGKNPQSKKEYWGEEDRGDDCLAYNDRGENTHSIKFKDYKEFFECYKEAWCEFVYLFNPETKTWKVQDTCKRKANNLGNVLSNERY